MSKVIVLDSAPVGLITNPKANPLADNKALDGDVILVAQSILVANYGHEVIIATSNKKHLSIFIDAREWGEI